MYSFYKKFETNLHFNFNLYIYLLLLVYITKIKENMTIYYILLKLQ